jgi:hypothetical protein
MQMNFLSHPADQFGHIYKRVIKDYEGNHSGFLRLGREREGLLMR